MIAQHNDDVKTVHGEMERVPMRITVATTEGKIDGHRDIELYDYLCCADRVLTDANAFKIIEAVEAKLDCWKCEGMGRVIVYDGVDRADGYFEITDSEVVRCPVCGG